MQSMDSFLFFFFFFQAEDGIRDVAVTGVQTCALPICLLTQFPTDVRAACEFRHASWWSDDVYELLRSTNTALCIADTEEGTTPLVATADFGYLRLRDEGYAEDSLRDWTQKVQAWGDACTDAYIFFKHEEKGMGPKLARQFLTLAVDTPRPPTPESDKRSGPEK